MEQGFAYYVLVVGGSSGPLDVQVSREPDVTMFVYRTRYRDGESAVLPRLLYWAGFDSARRAHARAAVLSALSPFALRSLIKLSNRHYVDLLEQFVPKVRVASSSELISNPEAWLWFDRGRSAEFWDEGDGPGIGARLRRPPDDPILTRTELYREPIPREFV
ncbi:MAG: hypothetical protein JNM04_00545 [Chthonomonas sp.]|nr:hypothetical protein [Chthonomonas sp.]